VEDFLKELNESQHKAVVNNDGPSLVIAGAGSGKTRVLTYKIAYLLKNGIAPYNILALTFTNKAAREMKNRIATLVGADIAWRLQMGTFHSIFSRILRREADKIGFRSDFTIYDSQDSRNLIKAIIKELKLDDKLYKPAAVQARISKVKNALITPDQYAVDYELNTTDIRCNRPATRDIYSIYCNRCRISGVMDFDDLLLYTYLLFRDFPDVIARYRNQFRFIMVDEYQDTNSAQHEIMLQLAEEHRRICVVGDDAQSIYSFRGANIGNILNFMNIYPESRLFKLEQNYRSTQTIVNAANSLIHKNKEQIPKTIFSTRQHGDKIQVIGAYSDLEEGSIVAGRIAEMRMLQHLPYTDFAILYRTNAQSRIFEEALRKRNIPYRIYGGLSFFQRKEIKDIIAYYRIVCNPNDEEAFKRIINYPIRGIGDTTVGKIISSATTHGVSLWRIISDPLAYNLPVNNGVINKLNIFKSLIGDFMESNKTMDAYELGKLVVNRAGIAEELYRDKTPEGLSRVQNIEELINSLHEFVSSRQEQGLEDVKLSDFLAEISLMTDQDTDQDESAERVVLMTVHSAKGLEFKNVFVVGMEDNLFPNIMVGESLRALEEERRLFYVAITRAEEHCFLSYARTRFRYGKMEFGTPSRFLEDIDARFLSLPRNARLSSKVDEEAGRFRRENSNGFSRSPHTREPLYNSEKGTPQLSKQPIVVPNVPHNLKRVTPPAMPSSASEFMVKPGQHIEHERFGLGEVIKVEGDGDNTKATIRFNYAGDKQLLLRFARFKMID